MPVSKAIILIQIRDDSGEKNSRCLLEIELTGLAYGLVWKIREREIKNDYLISGFGDWMDCGTIYQDRESWRVEFVFYP